MQKCILVTGGAGFIGCALSHGLCEHGLPVVAVDNLLKQVHPGGKRPKLLHRDVSMVREDVSDKSAWTRFLATHDPVKVVHLAAETGTGQSLGEASRHVRTNVSGTSEMLDAFARVGVRPRRIVLTSSRAVYGEGMWRDISSGRAFYPPARSHSMLARAEWSFAGPDGGQAEPCPHDARHVMPMPASIYGATKLAQESILAAWCTGFDVPLTVLRLQNVYGVGQSPFNPYTGIINIFDNAARAGQSIPVFEDGNMIRDFIYIDDVVSALMATLSAEPPVQGTIDVGTGTATTILEAATIIAKMHGAPAPNVCGKFRDGDIRAAVADVEELERRLGVKARVGIREGFSRVSDWLATCSQADVTKCRDPRPTANRTSRRHRNLTETDA